MRPGLRFKITDLFVVTLSVAIGCAVAQTPQLSWSDGVFLSVTFMVAVLTGQECLALDRLRKAECSIASMASLTREQRFELAFLAWSRFTVVTLLALTLSVDLLHRLAIITLPEGDSWPSDGQWGRAALIDLALLVCLCSPTLPWRPAPRSLGRTLISLVASLAAIFWAAIALTDTTLIHFLVFIAVEGIEFAQPSRFTRIVPQENKSTFAYLLIAQSLLVLALAVTLRALARQWTSPLRWRLTLVLVLLLGTVLLAAGTWTLITGYFREISPAMFEGIVIGPVHRWLVTALIIGISSVAWTYLALRDGFAHGQSAAEIPVNWPFLRFLGPVLVFAFYGVYGVLVATALVENPFFEDTFDWETLFYLLGYPMYFFPFAVWVTAAVQLWRLWKSRRAVPRVVLYGITPSALATVASFSILLGALGGAVLAWTSFALWLTPWYLWP
jgi:hypothetical protein